MSKRYLVLLASLILIITGCANEPTAPGNTHAEWDYIVTAEAIQANMPDLSTPKVNTQSTAAAQIQTFAAKYESNARPILPQNGRPVLDHN